jgi:protease YdgD
MRYAGALAALIAWAAAAPPAGAISPAFPPLATGRATAVHRVAVFGSDDRVRLPARYRKLGAGIGFLYHPRAHSACTAFCVGRATIVTAAHCLYRTAEEKPPRLRDFSFRLHPRRPGKSSRILGYQSHAAAQSVMAGGMRLSVRPPIDATRDWAVVRLAEPVCPAQGLRISTMSTQAIAKRTAEGAVYQIAYHRDFGNWELALGRNCRVQAKPKDDLSRVAQDFAQPANLLLHGCDTGGASSGSPMFVDGPNGPEVVGINVGTYVQSKVKTLNGEVLERFRSDEVANTAISATAFAPLLSAFVHADLLSTPADIRKLQALLAAQGRYTAALDGAYGPKLHDAIKSYERAASMPVTGLASRQLLRRLETSPLSQRSVNASLAFQAP